jgi:DNA-binding beta-propeller fold protein YncE
LERKLQYISIAVLLIITYTNAWSQAPNISYNPASYTFTQNTAIAPIILTNSGGTPTASAGLSAAIVFATISTPWDVANDAAGNVYTMDEGAGIVYKITPAGVMSTFATVPTPTGIAVDGLGNVYVSDYNDNRVYKFGPAGGTATTIFTGLNVPYGIAIDNANNAYVVNSGNKTISKIAAGATTISTFATPTLPSPYGIAISPSGVVFVSQNTTTGTVLKFTLTSPTLLTTFTGFNAPRQLGSDASGNIFIADYGNNAIKQIAVGATAAGAATTFYNTSLSTPRLKILFH